MATTGRLVLRNEYRNEYQGAGRPRHGRNVDIPATVALLDRLAGHPEFERLSRAIEQYRQAMNYWRTGKETFAISHLWMAVEALTKTALRRALTDFACADEIALMSKLGLDDIAFNECHWRAKSLHKQLQ
jgi:hypothetical protein